MCLFVNERQVIILYILCFWWYALFAFAENWYYGDERSYAGKGKLFTLFLLTALCFHWQSTSLLTSYLSTILVSIYKWFLWVLLSWFVFSSQEDQKTMKAKMREKVCLICVVFYFIMLVLQTLRTIVFITLMFCFMMFFRSDQKWARLILIIKSFTMHSSSESNMLLSGCYRLCAVPPFWSEKIIRLRSEGQLKYSFVLSLLT